MIRYLIIKLLELQRKGSRIFDALLEINEIYVRLYFLFFHIRGTRISQFIYDSHGNKYLIKTIDENYLKEVQYFFEKTFSTVSEDYFLPHKTDCRTLRRLLRKSCCVVLGVFDNHLLIGYAIIRLFFPKKGFYAIFIADNWQGKGIGTAALQVQLNLINDLGFYPYSIVYKRNIKSIRMLQKLGVEFLQDLGDSILVRDTIRKRNKG